MNLHHLGGYLIVGLFCCTLHADENRPSATYKADWKSLDTRPNPQWFGDAKFGIFIHWGVYAVPAWGPKNRYAEWYWYDMMNKESATWKFHKRTFGEDFPYQHFAHDFRAELFDPDQWADIMARSGAKYVVLTSKHHEGFCLWPNEQSWNWNSMDIGPKRDLCGDLTAAVRKRGLKMGFYYSLYEWFNPLFTSDVHAYVNTHMMPQLKDLVQRYQPDIVWPDGEWNHPSKVWRSEEFLAWLYNDSKAPKDVAVNDRWGKEARNTHGGFATPEYGHLPDGRLVNAGRWEECQGMGLSFGYNRNETVDEYRTSTQLVHLLIDVASRGGNLLLDIGPTADGRIPEIMQQRLLDIGKWLRVNGEAIYGSKAWRVQGEDERLTKKKSLSDGKFPLVTKEIKSNTVCYTAKGDVIYALVLVWPGEKLVLREPNPKSSPKVSMLGLNKSLKAKHQNGRLVIDMDLRPDEIPCQHAFVFRVEGCE